jgi:hypothetical protein
MKMVRFVLFKSLMDHMLVLIYRFIDSTIDQVCNFLLQT